MMLHALVVTAGLLALADRPDAKKDLDKLHGTWAVVSVERDGKERSGDEVKDFRLELKDDKFTYKAGTQAHEGTFKIDPAKKPKEIDATRGEGADKGKTRKGIYEFDGDNLKLCFGEPDGDTRPGEFSGKEGSKQTYYVFKRVKE